MIKKMNKEWKNKWLTALRSGEYEQGYGELFNGEGYCCLGVLRKVASLHDHKKFDAYKLGHDPNEECNDTVEMDTTLSVEELNRFGLTNSIQLKLAQFNDGERDVMKLPVAPWTFKQIAAYIEKYL